ncbi:hypothetical protein L210DRAFT_975286 [Boletus edulis BED1]|uniref:Uncharacterized protein n=1 Tax=Boletus edulis BED1 TaxID=1328754 RepID=A0AAD4BG57_BOLED|nr:hypothetical protein L210DRAFT_975286 [Boletus edulis BED1]
MVEPLCVITQSLSSPHSRSTEVIGLTPVTMQTEMTLGDTSAGSVLVADMREMQKEHEKKLVGLKREMEEATRANDFALRAGLAEEHQALQLKMACTTIEEMRG